MSSLVILTRVFAHTYKYCTFHSSIYLIALINTIINTIIKLISVVDRIYIYLDESVKRMRQ